MVRVSQIGGVDFRLPYEHFLFVSAQRIPVFEEVFRPRC
jgi:hypothetical protein